MIFPDKNCFYSRVIGNTQIYIQELVKAEEPDLKLLLLMSNKAASEDQPLCNVAVSPVS